MFLFLMGAIRKLLIADKLLLVPSLSFYFLLVQVDPLILKQVTPDQLPSPAIMGTVSLILLGHLLVALLTTVMGASVQETGQAGLPGGLWRFFKNYIVLVWVLFVTLIPIMAILAAVSFIHIWLVVGLLAVLVFVGVLTVPLFPILVFRGELRWYKVPFVAFRIARDRLAVVMMTTAFVYFVKLLSVFLGILLSNIPVLGESFFLPVMSGLSDCIAILSIMVFYKEFVAPGTTISKIV